MNNIQLQFIKDKHLKIVANIGVLYLLEDIERSVIMWAVPAKDESKIMVSVIGKYTKDMISIHQFLNVADDYKRYE